MTVRGDFGPRAEDFITLKLLLRAVKASMKCFRYVLAYISFHLTTLLFCFLKNGCSLFIMCPPPQAFFSSITDMCENGGKRPTPEVNVGFTKEQADTIRRIRNSKDSWDMLGVKPGATR